MDDVIVIGNDGTGQNATLELQAKRTVEFTTSDPVFADVVAFAVRTAKKPEFDSQRYEVAVAIARSSTKIDRHIQEVLRWVRQYQVAEEFFRRLNQTRVAHQAMRDFVDAFRGHMRAAGEIHDDMAVWRLLRRFQILAFDFEQPGSMCALYARERCAALLASPATSNAPQLWDSLQLIALTLDSVGGDTDAVRLIRELTEERQFRFKGDRRLHMARERLAEMAEGVLASIHSEVQGVQLNRREYADQVDRRLETARYIEILGAGGVGKSGVLKHVAQRTAAASRVFAISPSRLPGGGWLGFQSALGCQANAHEFFTDLACDGGATLFIDGLDRFDEPTKRETVADLLRAAASVKGFQVIATARLDFDLEARHWIPRSAIEELKEAPPLQVEELNEDELEQLSSENPRLRALLRPGHPAERLVKNLYRLDRLSRSTDGGSTTPRSEAQMALQWWRTGDGPEDHLRRDRRRLLRELAAHSLTHTEAMDSSATPGPAIDALIKSGSLQELNAVQVEFAHDVLRDWAIGCLIVEEMGRIDVLPLAQPAPTSLVRGLEMAARMHAENDPDRTAWLNLLKRTGMSDVHGSWRRAVLLSVTRSEQASLILDRWLPWLIERDGASFIELIRTAVAVDSQPAAEMWQSVGFDIGRASTGLDAPRGPSWRNLILWSVKHKDQIPSDAVPLVVDLYKRWSTCLLGQDPLSPILIGQLYSWLVEAEHRNHPRETKYSQWRFSPDAPGLSLTDSQERDLRTAFLAWSKLRPELAEHYLDSVSGHPYRHVLFRELLTFLGSAVEAAPRATCDLFLSALSDGDTDDAPHRIREFFPHWDNDYFPASPARPPFLGLLLANRDQGLKLVHGVISHALGRLDPRDKLACISLPLPTGPRSFTFKWTYSWSRGQTSSVLASALMALEAWGHIRIEKGDALELVLDDLLGPPKSPAAYLQVAVDVLLSHWPQSKPYLWPFAASAELLSFDRDRYAYDLTDSRDSVGWVHPEPIGCASLDSLKKRPSRGLALDLVLPDYGYYGPPEIRDAMKGSLQVEAERIGPPDGDSCRTFDARFAAMSAVNQLDPANYRVEVSTDGREAITYHQPQAERELVAEVQSEVETGAKELSVQLRLSQSLRELSCTDAFLKEALIWATGVHGSKVEQSSDEKERADRARFAAAALLFRDGSEDLREKYEEWAYGQLRSASNLRVERGMPPRLMPYNAAAIAAVGYLSMYRSDRPAEALRNLLHLAIRPDSGMASVLRYEVNSQRKVSKELFRSLARLGLVAAIHAVARHEHGDLFADDYEERVEAREAERASAESELRSRAVEEEMDWLANGKLEPSWPELPMPKPPKARRRLVAGSSSAELPLFHLCPPTFAFDSSAAAPWLELAAEQFSEDQSASTEDLLTRCWPWTAAANGVGSRADEEPSERPYEWNNSYFRASVVASISSTKQGGFAELLFKPMSLLPEERFFDATHAALFKLDLIWLDKHEVSSTTVEMVRDSIIEQLAATSSWQRLISRPSNSIERHMGSAVAAIYMGHHDFASGPSCYLLPAGAVHAATLLPKLSALAEAAAASTFVALAFLEFFKATYAASRIGFLTRLVSAWWLAHGADSSFWVDYGIGARACTWIERAVLQDGALVDTEMITATDLMIGCGIPEAAVLEASFIKLGQRKPPP